MSAFRIVFDDRVEYDIDEAVDYYSSRATGLGNRFYTAVKNTIAAIESTPYFQVRYNNIRCLPVKNFPYMVHFSVHPEEKLIRIRAIINCYQNPDTTWLVNEP